MERGDPGTVIEAFHITLSAIQWLRVAGVRHEAVLAAHRTASGPVPTEAMSRTIELAGGSPVVVTTDHTLDTPVITIALVPEAPSHHDRAMENAVRPVRRFRLVGATTQAVLAYRESDLASCFVAHEATGREASRHELPDGTLVAIALAADGALAVSAERRA